MTWFVPVVDKWIDMLVEERKFSDSLRTRSKELMQRLHGIVVTADIDLEQIDIPSVENEPLPIEESTREATIALTWLAPFGRSFQLMYIEDLDKVRLRVGMGMNLGEEDVDDPTDAQILEALLKMGVRQRPVEPETPMVVVPDEQAE